MRKKQYICPSVKAIEIEVSYPLALSIKAEKNSSGVDRHSALDKPEITTSFLEEGPEPSPFE